MFGPFESRIVADDAKFFTSTIGKKKLTVPTLALGGEALMSFLTRPAFENFTETLEVDIAPKAGHWITDENPIWVANRVASFLANDTSSLPVANLSSLMNQVTLTVSLYGTLRNFALAGGGIL
ncbi:hypothetical protein QC761_703530 [Podospora bellae-mahoneyi]|uniref:Uncharacterized protein n=1 Tax=Podospora bellae-mahoneyi TaxID=2093777 RepID=A0ABR0F7C9_9PEZI|nr:hypothetical protein QC761_703530 [Podospora bellae-mahoneyi]